MPLSLVDSFSRARKCARFWGEVQRSKAWFEFGGFVHVVLICGADT